MRRLSAQWCVQMNGFIFGTCVLVSYQSHPYKESALIPVSWKVGAATRLLSVQL